GFTAEEFAAWMDRVGIYKCPSLTIEFPQHYAVNTNDFTWTRVGTGSLREINTNTSGTPHAAMSKLDDALRPSSTAFMTEINADHLQSGSVTNKLSNMNVWTWNDLPYHYLSGAPQPSCRMVPHDDRTRHMNAQTVSFFDGHAAALGFS